MILGREFALASRITQTPLLRSAGTSLTCGWGCWTSRTWPRSTLRSWTHVLIQVNCLQVWRHPLMSSKGQRIPPRPSTQNEICRSWRKWLMAPYESDRVKRSWMTVRSTGHSTSCAWWSRSSLGSTLSPWRKMKMIQWATRGKAKEWANRQAPKPRRGECWKAGPIT